MREKGKMRWRWRMDAWMRGCVGGLEVTSYPIEEIGLECCEGAGVGRYSLLVRCKVPV